MMPEHGDHGSRAKKGLEMTDTVTLKGIDFSITHYGESDLFKLTCPYCHPGVDFKKDEVVEIDGARYLVYLVGDHTINLQRMYPPEHFQTVGHLDHGRTSLTVAIMFTQTHTRKDEEGPT